jgi:sugar fermentation stimulation protein A
MKMHFSSPLQSGTLIKRYKRFFADIALDDGTVITAHCANTGAMTGCAEPGFRAWVSPANNPKRKLKYTWELAQDHNKNWIGVNTQTANALVEEALKLDKIAELPKLLEIKREVTPPGGTSRFDFQLITQTATEPLYLEVKSVTLARGTQGYFPDAVTTRGHKHCRELIELAHKGVATALLFCVQHTGVQSVNFARDIDPVYASLVQEAQQAGVQIIANGCAINQQKIEINQSLKVFL